MIHSQEIAFWSFLHLFANRLQRGCKPHLISLKNPFVCEKVARPPLLALDLQFNFHTVCDCKIFGGIPAPPPRRWSQFGCSAFSLPRGSGCLSLADTLPEHDPHQCSKCVLKYVLKIRLFRRENDDLLPKIL